MAECLYYGDKPIGIVQSKAEDVEYSSGVSVKDKIDVLNDKFEWKEVGRVLSNSSSATSANLSESIDNKNEIMILLGYTSYDNSSRFSYVVPMSLFKTHGFWGDITNADYYTASNQPTRDIVQFNYIDATHISVSQAPATGSSVLAIYIKFYAR